MSWVKYDQEIKQYVEQEQDKATLELIEILGRASRMLAKQDLRSDTVVAAMADLAGQEEWQDIKIAISNAYWGYRKVHGPQ